jgi:hypothetical protein
LLVERNEITQTSIEFNYFTPLRNFIRILKQSGFLRKLLATDLFFKFKMKFIIPTGLLDKVYLTNPIDENWKARINDVMICPENDLIEKVPDAGKVKNGKQIMHNGIVTSLSGYYGDGVTQMLFKNKGVHEPQEEYAFDVVLKGIRPGATMIELGSYWSFYSIWFNKAIKNARTFLVEPLKNNMLVGINNFRLNKVKGKFTNAFIGKTSGVLDGIPIICIDDYVEDNKIEFVDILHADIQAFEYDMLLGASKTINKNKIGYFFISTHNNDLHYKCIDFLKAHNFSIVCDADLDDSFSLDGLIVAKANYFKGINQIGISLKTKVFPNLVAQNSIEDSNN